MKILIALVVLGLSGCESVTINYKSVQDSVNSQVNQTTSTNANLNQ